VAEWRVPTDDDWKVIEGTVDSTYGVGHEEWDETGWRGDDAGSAMAGEFDLWTNYTTGLRNHARFGVSGIDILPSGRRATTGTFTGIDGRAFLWSTTTGPISSNAFRRYLSYIYTNVERSASDKAGGFALRLIRDDISGDPNGTVYANAYTGNDGKTYDAVKVGPFKVLSENLAETKYADGTDIPEITDDTAWSNDADGARCYYDNDSDNEDPYGLLYNWFVLENEAGIVAEQTDTTEAELDLVGSSELEVAAKRVKTASVELTGESQLEVEGNRTRYAGLELVGESQIEVEGRVAKIARMVLEGLSEVAIESRRIRYVRAALVGLSQIVIVATKSLGWFGYTFKRFVVNKRLAPPRWRQRRKR